MEQRGRSLQMIEGNLVGAICIATETSVNNFLVLPVGMLKVGLQERDTVQRPNPAKKFPAWLDSHTWRRTADTHR
jgi:hypothetical protein